MAELSEDSEFRRRQMERHHRRAERQAKHVSEIKPILDDLNRLGVDVTSMEELVRQYEPLSPDIVNILLMWLPRADEIKGTGVDSDIHGI